MEQKEKKTVLVAFSTQKGGIGKSALTVLMASYFHYVKGYTVGVIDCDYPQYSIHKMRERDKEIVNTVPYYKEKSFSQYKELGKRNYPVDKVYEKGIGELGLSVMKNFLPDTKRYRHEMTELIAPIFRCTLFPVDKRLVKGSRLDLLANELEELIHIKE